MLNKKDICAEIGNFFGEFYEDVSGFLVIDDGETDHIYATEDELLKDWLPTLKEADEDTGDEYWADIIEYIEDAIL